MNAQAQDSCLCWLAGDGGMQWWHKCANRRKLIQALSNRVCGVLIVPDRIRESVKLGILTRSLRKGEFRKAYEIDGLRADEFISDGAAQRTLA